MADRNGYIGRAPGDSSVTIARQTNTLTGIQTTFVFNSGYDVGYLDVFINGTKLINATDYQATDTQNVTLTVAGQSGDVLEFVAYKAFNLSTVVAEATDLNVTGSLTVNGDQVVESLTAGANISLSGSNGDVTITGLAATDVIVAERVLVSGVTTSTGGFVGNLTGNVTGNTSGTAGGLTGTPNITVGSVDATTGTFSGNVSIAGTLTYEDVTNVDSVGIVTAGGGVIATGLGVSVASGGVRVTGIVTATSFSGDGSALTGLSGWSQEDTWLYGGG